MNQIAARDDPTLRAPFSDAHILVVDDDVRLLRLLKRYIESAGYRVTTAPDAKVARSLLNGIRFDLLVLDVMLPGESGLELTASIRRAIDTPVLLLSALGETDERCAGLAKGADDYLPKPFEPRELLLRIRAILQRADSTRLDGGSPVTLHFGERRYDVVKGELHLPNRMPLPLNGIELQLMQVLARRHGETLSRETLLAELNEGLGSGAGRVIDVRVTRLRRKLEPDSRNPRYLKTVRGHGYVLAPDRVEWGGV